MIIRNIMDGVIVLIGVFCFVLILVGAYKGKFNNIYTEHKNVIICETDLIQSCKTYKHVEVLDSTVNHIVIKNHENTFTLKGRIFNYE